MKRTLVLAISVLAACVQLSAYDFMEDGICYVKNADGKSVNVTFEVNSNSVPRYSSLSGEVIIPEYVSHEGNSYEVTAIGWHSFEKCVNITSISLPNTLKWIGFSAFWNCSGLTSIVIPNSVTEIGEQAFYSCSNLSEIQFGESIEGVGASAFAGTPWLNNQPDGLLYIGKNAYKYIGEMPPATNIQIKEGTKGLSGDCFAECDGLQSLTIPKTVTFIGYHVVHGCNNLTDMVVDPENQVFDSRDNCNSIIITDTNALVIGCAGSTIPSTVTTIDYEAFLDCAGLTSITIPDNVTKIDQSAFQGCVGLTSVDFGNGITKIEGSAFRNCSGLTSVTIPASVTEIGNSTFSGCSNLKQLEIGCSVTRLGGFAFFDCISLEMVINNALTPQKADSYLFGNLDCKKCHLKVWHEVIDKYKEADVWKDFDIQDLGGVEGVEADAKAKTVEGYYNLQGVRFDNPERGQVSIIRYTDGSAAKVFVR